MLIAWEYLIAEILNIFENVYLKLV